MYYVLFTKIIQGADTVSGTVLQKKRVQEFVVKTLDRYTNKEIQGVTETMYNQITFMFSTEYHRNTLYMHLTKFRKSEK